MNATPARSAIGAAKAVPGRLTRPLIWLARILTIALALLLLLLAASMDRNWANRHMLYDILVANSWLMTVLQTERLLLAAAAMTLLLVVYPRIGLLAAKVRAARGAGRWVGIGAALLLALPASEGAIRLATGRTGQAWSPFNEPLRRSDPLLGWVNIPSREAVDPDYASRPVYVIDRNGYRIAAGSLFDATSPAVLFAGESIMFGKGLNWPDTIAGQIEATSGVKSANMAVAAYSTGQTYLQLKRELPKFRHPLAIVILFGPSLMIRDLDKNRPWIDRVGNWHPARGAWHLTHLKRVLFPYHSSAAIDEAVAADRHILIAQVAMARARGTEPLILVPVFQPEPPQQHALRAAIFDGAAIPHVVVPLDQNWRLSPDSHPDARAHAAMAAAVWTRLKGRFFVE